MASSMTFPAPGYLRRVPCQFFGVLSIVLATKMLTTQGMSNCLPPPPQPPTLHAPGPQQGHEQMASSSAGTLASFKLT